jgi:hypothetical protein
MRREREVLLQIPRHTNVIRLKGCVSSVTCLPCAMHMNFKFVPIFVGASFWITHCLRFVDAPVSKVRALVFDDMALGSLESLLNARPARISEAERVKVSMCSAGFI